MWPSAVRCLEADGNSGNRYISSPPKTGKNDNHLLKESAFLWDIVSSQEGSLLLKRFEKSRNLDECSF